jgi:hypothetical protein
MHLLDRLSVRSKLYAGFAVVATALLVAVAVGWMSMLSVSRTVRDGVDRAVVARIGTISQATGEIAAVAEQSSASAEQVSASTEETAATAHELATTAQGLSETAAELDRLVRQFTLAHE